MLAMISVRSILSYIQEILCYSRRKFLLEHYQKEIFQLKLKGNWQIAETGWCVFEMIVDTYE